MNSRSSMGFFGFKHNMTSALGIYNDYVKNGPLDYFSNFQFSQDNLKTFFIGDIQTRSQPITLTQNNSNMRTKIIDLYSKFIKSWHKLYY